MEMNKEQIEKPFNLRVVELKESIIKSIGDAKLPATIIQLVLSEIKNGVDVQTQQIIANEKLEYNKKFEEVNNNVY